MNVSASTLSRQSLQTQSKSCNTCKVDKPLDFFYRKTEAPDGRQGKCKDCHKARQRDWKNSTAPSRQKVEADVELSAEQKQHIYSNVILRMYESGLMSHKTALESLERVLR